MSALRTQPARGLVARRVGRTDHDDTSLAEALLCRWEHGARRGQDSFEDKPQARREAKEMVKVGRIKRESAKRAKAAEQRLTAPRRAVAAMERRRKSEETATPSWETVRAAAGLVRLALPAFLTTKEIYDALDLTDAAINRRDPAAARIGIDALEKAARGAGLWVYTYKRGTTVTNRMTPLAKRIEALRADAARAFNADTGGPDNPAGRQSAPSMAEEVHGVLRACLFRSEELSDGKPQPAPDSARAEGIVSTFFFHPGRLAECKPKIGALLRRLPQEFMKTGGGGWSFLNMCMTSDGEQWGEHRDCEALLALGIATCQASYLMPREIWDAFPGGMPYVVIDPVSLEPECCEHCGGVLAAYPGGRFCGAACSAAHEMKMPRHRPLLPDRIAEALAPAPIHRFIEADPDAMPPIKPVAPSPRPALPILEALAKAKGQAPSIALEWSYDEEGRRILGGDLGMDRGREIVAQHVHPDLGPLLAAAPDLGEILLRLIGQPMRDALEDSPHHAVADDLMDLIRGVARG